MFHYQRFQAEKGVTLIETIVFVVVVSIALVALLRVFNQSVIASVDPVTRSRAIELAQATLDEILARKFAENTPTGGVPACGSATTPACTGITADSDYDDVGDFNGFTDNSNPGHLISVTVADAALGGVPAIQSRLITVTVTYATGSGSDQLTLSAYKVNF